MTMTMKVRIEHHAAFTQDTWKMAGQDGGHIHIRTSIADPGRAWFLIFKNSDPGDTDGTPVYFTADELDLLALRLTQIAGKLRSA
jgi:hypothetical protein